MYSYLYYCSGENSPVEKKSPMRELPSEGQTGMLYTIIVFWNWFVKISFFSSVVSVLYMSVWVVNRFAFDFTLEDNSMQTKADKHSEEKDHE